MNGRLINRSYLFFFLLLLLPPLFTSSSFFSYLLLIFLHLLHLPLSQCLPLHPSPQTHSLLRPSHRPPFAHSSHPLSSFSSVFIFSSSLSVQSPVTGWHLVPSHWHRRPQSGPWKPCGHRLSQKRPRQPGVQRQAPLT